MSPDKRLSRARARHLRSGLDIDGYEIHIGATTGPDCARPFAEIGGAPEGAASADGRITGSYLHGMFADDAFRAAFLAELGAPNSGLQHGALVEQTLDQLAAHLEAHCDVDALLGVAR